MDTSKLNVKVGAIEFSAEGKADWLSAQLDKVLEAVPKLASTKVTTSHDHSTNVLPHTPSTPRPTNLALFLKEKGATTNQNKKFLATAAFNQLNGTQRQTTADVTKALKDASQSRLGNPSDCLNQNVYKGYCEKDGSKGFFVTEAGLTEIGIKSL